MDNPPGWVIPAVVAALLLLLLLIVLGAVIGGRKRRGKQERDLLASCAVPRCRPDGPRTGRSRKSAHP